MASTGLTGKRALINQANSTVVIAAGVAAFIVVFSLVATKTLISQSKYQNHVISKERIALNQLKSDITASNALAASYKAFTGSSQNVLGGNSDGTGPQDGDNAKIVLDALPSSYDFPALVTSIQQLALKQPGLKITKISGNDDEVAQSANQTSATPAPVPMPFEITVSGDYASVQALISQFEHSIRPIQIQTMKITGSQDKLTLDITAQTYYQPAKSLTIKKQVVK